MFLKYISKVMLTPQLLVAIIVINKLVDRKLKYVIPEILQIEINEHNIDLHEVE